MTNCKDCIHEKVCVIKAFPDAFENTQWDIKPCGHFKPTTDFADAIQQKLLNKYTDTSSAVSKEAFVKMLADNWKWGEDSETEVKNND